MATIEFANFLKRSMLYCAKAEHCTQDVLKKMESWEVPEEMIDQILEKLRIEKYLDDARYANSYVADKWRLDQWGIVKIKNGLFQKGISESLIQNAIDTIDLEGYIAIVKNILDKKRETIKKEPKVSQMKKLLSYGSSRGFEEDLIWQWMEQQGLSFDADNS